MAPSALACAACGARQEDDPVVVLPPAIRLLVRDARGHESIRELRTGVVTIGRAPHNAVVVDDPAVSATHAVLRVAPGSCAVADLGSRNGVFVNGERVAGTRRLARGDEVALGSTVISVLGPVAPARPLPRRTKRPKSERPGARIRAARIKFASFVTARVVKAVVTIGLGLAVGGYYHGHGVTVSESKALAPPAGAELVAARPFGETRDGEPNNASGIVPLADSRFLVVDNRTDDALYELDLDATGAMRGPLVSRRLDIPGGAIGDMEAITTAEEGGRTWTFVASALDRKVKKKVDYSPRGGLLRVTERPDGAFTTENVDGFREWFVRSSPDVGDSAIFEPDKNGLNIEGLAWDASRHALLFGVRSPVPDDGRPLVIPVRVKDLAGPWDASNLEMLPAIHLALPFPTGDYGIRDIHYDASRGVFLVLVGNALSHEHASFRLLAWDGNPEGSVTEASDLWFAPHFKAEGVCHGTVGGRGAIVVVDDGGGYQVVWDDDPRLAAITPPLAGVRAAVVRARAPEHGTARYQNRAR
jgi:hypothetical protein